MATATIQGSSGNATLPTGFNAKISSWKAKYEIMDVETSGFGDAGNHTYEPVAIGMSGSVDGTGESGTVSVSVTATVAPATLNGATPDLTTAKGSMVLTATTGVTFTFTAIITNVNMTRAWNGKMDVSFDFKATGAITQAWA